MGKLQKQFESKYGFDAVNFIKELGNRFLGIVKSIGLQSAIVGFADEKGFKIPMDEKYTNSPSDSFLIDLIQAMAEAGQKFPENQKVSIGYLGDIAEVSSIDVSVPKSKGVLEDFKDIVSDDDLRPSMTGVFVSTDGFLVGTDAHKLVKFKNSTFSKDADKIIDLNAYIKSKGDVLRFIDGKYPNYEAVIPRDNPNKVKNLPTYAFYNFCKSAVALKKLQTSDVFNVNFKEKGEEISFNPILFAELLGFALAKGFDTFDLQYSTTTRAFLFTFEGGSEGILMPIYNKDGLVGTKPYTFDEVISEFGNGGKAKATKTKTLPKKSESKEPKKEAPYKKYEGSLDDVTYIPRRDISIVILKNGDELTSADIIDGVYRLKKKFAKGGEVNDNEPHHFTIYQYKDRLALANNDFDYIDGWYGTKQNVIDFVEDSIKKGLSVYSFVQIEDDPTWTYKTADGEKMRREIVREDKFAEGGEVGYENTKKLIQEIEKYSDYSQGTVSTTSDGEKYRYDHWTLKYKSASNWLVLLFEKASKENTGKNYLTEFDYGDYSFHYSRPELKGKQNGKMSMKKLVLLNNKMAKGGDVGVHKLTKLQEKLYNQILNSPTKSMNTYNLERDVRRALEDLYYMELIDRKYIGSTQEATYTLKKGLKVAKKYTKLAYRKGK